MDTNCATGKRDANYGQFFGKMAGFEGFYLLVAGYLGLKMAGWQEMVTGYPLPVCW